MAACSGCFLRSFPGRSSNKRLDWGSSRLIFPIFEPAGDPSAEIARTLGKKMFSQFRGPPLQVLLTYFNYRQKFVPLAFPFRFLIPVAKPISQKTQIMGASEQIGQLQHQHAFELCVSTATQALGHSL